MSTGSFGGELIVMYMRMVRYGVLCSGGRELMIDNGVNGVVFQL